MWPEAAVAMVLSGLGVVGFAIQESKRVKARIKVPFFSFAIEIFERRAGGGGRPHGTVSGRMGGGQGDGIPSTPNRKSRMATATPEGPTRRLGMRGDVGNREG